MRVLLSAHITGIRQAKGLPLVGQLAISRLRSKSKLSALPTADKLANGFLRAASHRLALARLTMVLERQISIFGRPGGPHTTGASVQFPPHIQEYVATIEQ